MPSIRLACTLVTLALSAPLAACGGDGGLTAEIPAECNPLGGAGCITPWPWSGYLVDDASTATGVRLDIPENALPANLDGKAVSGTLYQDRDGFSAAAPMLVAFETGIDGANLVHYSNYAASITDESPTVIIDMSTGERVVHFAELNQRSVNQPDRQALYLRPALLLLLLLTPPILWLGIVYLGSLFALLLQSFFYIDGFTGLVVREFTLRTYAELFTPANIAVIQRTAGMAALVTVCAAAIAFPIAYYMARFASGRAKALFYLAVMLPLWSSYLVRVYAWKLLLAKEGVVTWLLAKLHLTWLLDGVLAAPVVGGPSLSLSYIGTFLVFVYIWLPYMILPIEAALERVPRSVIEASADLGARPGATFRRVILPLAVPGVAAGSIFTFSLTLGDYIIPTIIGNSRPFIGMVVLAHQGTAGNIPLAAAFAVVPIAIMALYLAAAKRLGAFDAL